MRMEDFGPQEAAWTGGWVWAAGRVTGGLSAEGSGAVLRTYFGGRSPIGMQVARMVLSLPAWAGGRQVAPLRAGVLEKKRI